MTIVMADKGKQRQKAEYTRLGDVASGQLARRGMRTNAEIARRISARGDYPGKNDTTTISDESVRNYFIGLHPVPPVFMHVIVDEMNKVEPLTQQERDDLEEAYLWGQGPKVSPILPANMEQARKFILGVNREEEGSKYGGQAKDL